MGMRHCYNVRPPTYIYINIYIYMYIYINKPTNPHQFTVDSFPINHRIHQVMCVFLFFFRCRLQRVFHLCRSHSHPDRDFMPPLHSFLAGFVAESYHLVMTNIAIMAMVISIEIDGLPIGISLEMEVLLGKSSNYHLVMTNIAMERSTMLLRTVNHLFRLGPFIPWLC